MTESLWALDKDSPRWAYLNDHGRRALKEAVAEIERLRAESAAVTDDYKACMGERDRLRAALAEIAKHPGRDSYAESMRKIAHRALGLEQNVGE